MTTPTVGCPFCHSADVRASLPATAQYFEYRCRSCKRGWFAESVGLRDPEPRDSANRQRRAPEPARDE
jgi:transposase-like protein